jgi:hypothetical protein
MKIMVFWQIRDPSSHPYKQPGIITLHTQCTHILKQHHNAVNRNKHLLSNSYSIALVFLSNSNPLPPTHHCTLILVRKHLVYLKNGITLKFFYHLLEKPCNCVKVYVLSPFITSYKLNITEEGTIC